MRRSGGFPTTVGGGSARVMLAGVVRCIIVRTVVDCLREVVLDDEERGQLELRRGLAHLADYVLVACIDTLGPHGLPLERPKLLLALC